MRAFLLQAFLLLLATLMLFPQLAGIADDPGLGWHLKNGQTILSTGSVPVFDTFLSGSINNFSLWIADQWLSDLIFYQVFQLGSWPALYILCISIFFAAFLCPLSSISKNFKLSYAAYLMAALICIRLGAIHFILRPVLFSFLLFALLLWYLVRFEPKKFTLKNYLLLGLLFLVWANMHPSFIIGIATLFLYLSFLKLSVPVGMFFLFCIAATLINPYTYFLHASILDLFTSNYFMQLNSEWLPLEAKSTEGLLTIVCTIFVFIAARIRGKGFFLPALVFVFNLLVFRSIRFLPYYALTLAPAFAINMDFILKNRLKVKFPEMNASMLTTFVSFVLLQIVYFTTLHGAELGPSKSVYPYKCLALINEDKGSVGSKVVLSHPNWGGFITWSQSNKQLKPVIDDRNTLLGEDFYREYFENMRTLEGLERLVTKHQVSYILLPRETSVLNNIQYNDREFSSVPCDDFAVLLKVIKN